MILDTLGKVKPPKASYEDSYQADYRLGSRLKESIDDSPGSTLLVVHHSRKAESTDFVDAVSGTQGIAGSADFLLVLSRKRHDDEAVLAVTGRDIAEREYALKSDGGLWTLDGTSLADAAKTVESRHQQRQLGDRSLEVLEFVASTLIPGRGTRRDTTVARRVVRRPDDSTARRTTPSSPADASGMLSCFGPIIYPCGSVQRARFDNRSLSV